MSGVKHTPGPDPVYYLRCIHRRLQTIQEAMPDEKGLSLGNIALADEADWLDGYIEEIARARGGQFPNHSDQKEVGNG
jgi:hypothetical protein